MNTNTIAALFGGTGRNQIPSQVVSTTTATVFTVNTDSGTPNPAVLSIPTGTGVVGASAPFDPNANASQTAYTGRQYGRVQGTQAPFFSNTAFNGNPFLVRISGTFTSGVAANGLTISLYLGSSATVGSDSLISAALTEASIAAVSGKFFVEFLLDWDVITGKLDGIVTNGFIAPAGGTAAVVGGTAVTETSAAAVSNLNFVASTTWGVANAGNTVNITEFSISQY